MDKKKIEKAVKMILEAVGEDPNRADLKKTPQRVADMYEEILSGISKDPSRELEVLLGEKHDEIVLLKGIPLYSMCEHHLLPFTGKAHIAYIPSSKVVGLSKLAKVVDIIAKRPQLQERMTTQICDAIEEALQPKGVLVVIEAQHFCMSMNDTKNSSIITSAVRGALRKDVTRAEAFSLIKS